MATKSSPSMWSEKLIESLDISLKKKSGKDRLHDVVKKRLKEEHREITQGFTQVVTQIQKESSGDTWAAAAEIAGALMG